METELEAIEIKEYENGSKATLRKSPEEYKDLEKSLCNFKDINRLELMAPISKCSNLDFLNSITHLKEIHINAMSELKNFSGLQNCRKLEKTSLGQRTRFDCSIIITLENLKEFLSLSTILIESYKIGFCSQLKKIEIWGMKAKNLNIFKNLCKLEYLRVWDGNIESANGIEKLENLYHLDLGRSKLAHAEAIGKIKHLSWLCLDYCSEINDLDFLSFSSQIRHLLVNHMKNIRNEYRL